jgi:hypothetical protein
MNATLTRPVTVIEIKEAVFSLGSQNAPGPDGLNGIFFKENWDTVKLVFCNAVCHFFASGDLLPEINETIITLTPKVLMPESISQLRPISCCNFIYKVIEKLMVKRLKGFMNSIISPN